MLLLPIEVWALEEIERRQRAASGRVVRGAGRRARRIEEAVEKGEAVSKLIEGQLEIACERAERLGMVEEEDNK